MTRRPLFRHHARRRAGDPSTLVCWECLAEGRAQRMDHDVRRDVFVCVVHEDALIPRRVLWAALWANGGWR